MFGFGKKAKELQEKKDLEQRVRLLESETKRLSAILEFLSYKKKMLVDDPTNSSLSLSPVLSTKLDEASSSDDFVQKIDQLCKIVATKDDVKNIETRFYEIFNTISGLFSRLAKTDDGPDVI